MFYSHQLLARKAPLGQIWMAATLHAKINRRKLNKLNIIQICEGILNPSIPMALRLSGILMGGVVIVYQRKVKLLYDDVSRLLVEINEAWKVKSAPDRTVLPKGKLQAKKEAVTLPDYGEADVEVEDVERSLNYSAADTIMGFQHHTAYFAMRLDTVDEHLINENAGEEGETDNFHQADAANITLAERFDLFQTDGNIFNRFERFDIEGDDNAPLNFSSGEGTVCPNTLIPSPPQHDEPHEEADEMHDQHPEDRANLPSDEGTRANQDKQRPRPTKRKTRRLPAFIMDNEQTIIPGHIYQSWLQNSSDIVSKGGRKRKRTNIMSTMKIANLMELPPVVIGCGLINENRKILYPASLMELWMRSNKPLHDAVPGRTSPPLPPERSSSSPQDGVGFQDLPGFAFGDMQSGDTTRSQVMSLERQRSHVPHQNYGVAAEFKELEANAGNNILPDTQFRTPGSYGDEGRSIPSSASGINSGRSNRRRAHSSSRNSTGGLPPLAEESIWINDEPNFGLKPVSENGATPDQELLVETGPTQTQTQTQFPFSSPIPDNLTDTIRAQMKAHFDTPGAPLVESLNHLACGMNRKGAAMLFYQTCVLASRDVLRVEQKVPYGDILISKGAKM